MAITRHIEPKLNFLNAKILLGDITDCDKNNWTGMTHHDDFSRLYIAQSGEGMLEFDHCKLPVVPGNIYLIPSLTNVKLHAHGTVRVIWIHFDLEFFPTMSVFNIFRPVNVIESSESDEEDFATVVNNLDSASPKVMLQKYSTFLRLVSKFMPDDRALVVPSETTLLKFQSAIDYINKNPQRPFDLKILAKMSCLQTEYFSRSFKHTFGISPIDYFIQCRMKLAKELLFNSEKTLKEISTLCGYNDQFYFAKTFKKYYGASPGTARKVQKMR